MATPKTKKTTPVKKPPTKSTGLKAGGDERTAVFELICERLRHGGSLAKACREIPSAPTPAAVLMWVNADPEFAKRYTQARAIGYLHLADELVEIADTPEIMQVITTKEWGLEVQRADNTKHRTLRLDTRKWLLSKMLPKVFGDRTATEHTASEALTEQLAQIAKRLPV